ncbi:unnamed protein product [Clonostachys chloroleuca]|uniref:Glucose-methanol-choline oxidoreductase C-terminal domain-containing protein n=1 Tax=Clonostachys chloroleuca TaxID=1926264 RepID=A0AA35M758_9HYPO|nr:unnamed protein product [Clonostachys chloroleuca]
MGIDKLDNIIYSGLVKEKNGEGATLDIILNCIIEKLYTDKEGRVHLVKTSKGVISLLTDETSIVLCAGTNKVKAFPNMTLLLNSFNNTKETIGKQVTSYFLTYLYKLEIAAYYLASENLKTKQQYYIQITAIYSLNPKEDANNIARDYRGAAKRLNKVYRFYLHNAYTHSLIATDKIRPNISNIRIPSIVHEASTAFVGSKEAGGSVNKYSRLHGIHNIYIIGGALFLTAGSWNLILIIYRFTQHLARHLSQPVV